MTVLAVIPVRMAAKRLPGKPLMDLGGRPVVEWAFRAASEARRIDRVVVATDATEIAAVVAGFGGEVMMTSSTHRTGTDRVAEVATRLGGHDIVVNVQGDQPFVAPEMLDDLLGAFDRGPPPVMATLGAPLPPGGRTDPDTVKVLVDVHGSAIYFSRAPVPHGTLGEGASPVLHHIGLYAFTSAFLARYARMTPTPLERMENLEQLRVVENGERIAVVVVPSAIIEINTGADLERAREHVRRRG